MAMITGIWDKNNGVKYQKITVKLAGLLPK